MTYLQALLGIVVFIALVLPMSSNRRSINWKLVGIAIALQFLICILLLKAPIINDGLLYLNRAVGALGGATNALTTRMRLREALRHILLGGLIAAGMGTLSMALVVRWLALPPEAIPAGGAAGSAAYLVGVFGPAVIEIALARLRAKGGGHG